MSLSREQFAGSVKRITAVFSMTPEQTTEYLETIFEQVNWMDPYFFDQSCKEIVRKFKAGARRPMPTEFLTEYNASRQRANVPGAVRTERCSVCEAIGYEFEYFAHRDGRMIEAVLPCKNCRKEARQSWQLREELTPISRGEYDRHRGKSSFATLIEQALQNIRKPEEANAK
jgi:hypothetical protein